MKIYFYTIALCLAWQVNIGQNVGINPGGTTPNASSILDLNTGNNFASPNGKGLIIPNVALTGTGDVTTVASAFTSLLVYNTATAGAAPTNVVPGYYYWDGAKWVSFSGTGSKDWSLTGNAGTAIGTNFLGTTDNVDLQLRVNNVRSGLINIASFQTFFGYAAGLNTTGIINSFFGYGAGQTTSTGTGNTAMGYYSLLLNSGGTDNTAIGAQSLYNTTGSANVAVGTNAGFSITTGTANVALGYYAMNNGSNTTTGQNNTAVGNSALQNCTIGSYNTGVGNLSMQAITTGSYNASTGHLSSLNMATGSFNVSMGYSSLKNNTGGSSNVALGGDAQFYFNASNNTAVGMWTLEGNSTPANNTGVGNTALGFCAGSGFNSGSGTPNNYQVTTGSYNTFVGYSSSISANSYTNTTALGAFSLAGANDVISLGGVAGTNGCTTTPKVGIGTSTPASMLEVVETAATSARGIISTEYNASSIGARLILRKARGTSAAPTAALNGDNTGLLVFTSYDGASFIDGATVESKATENWGVGLNGTSILFTNTNTGTTGRTQKMIIDQNGFVGIGIGNPGYLLSVNGQPGANGFTAFTNYSDARLKRDVSNVENNTLDKIMQLRPVQFKYNEQYLELYNDTNSINRLHRGFVAQEIKEVFPEMVGTTSVKGKEYYDLNLTNLQVYLVKAMQEQQVIINAQKEELKTMQLKMEELEKNIHATAPASASKK